MGPSTLEPSTPCQRQKLTCAKVAATANEEFRPLLGIPKAGITTYPLVDTEERPRKRARFTGVEDGIHERRDEDFQTAVLDAYGSFKTLDPSYQEKTKLADFLKLSFEKIDDWFRGRRSGMRPAPPLQIGSSEDHLDIDHESTVTRSNFQDLDCFTEAGEPSDTNLTKASTPTQERPCHCTSTGCSETFKSPSSWARHEKDVHWAQHKFLCLLCAVSGAGSHEQLSCASCSATHSALAACVEHVLQCEEARSQHSVRRKRHTGLKHHLKNAHPGELQRKAALETVKKTEGWHYPVDSNWPRLCTYINCSQSFRDWKERVDHYTGNHFQKSKRSSRRSFVSFQGEDSIPPTPA